MRYSIAIANPADGPGASKDPVYEQTINRARTAGVTVIGYVDTGYYGTTGHATRSGQRTVAAWTAQIQQDVDTWYQFYGTYGIDGIFFDQSPSLCGPNDVWADLYAAIRNYVVQRHPGAKVVANPGEAAEPCYARAADIFVMFEGDYASYLNWQPPAWELQVDPNRIWHLVYKATERADMETAIALSRQRNGTLGRPTLMKGLRHHLRVSRRAQSADCGRNDKTHDCASH